MKNEKAKNVLIIILLILVIIVVGALVYENVTGKTIISLFSKEKNNVLDNVKNLNEESKNKETIENKEENKTENVDKEVAEKYLEYIPSNTMYNKNAYQSKLVTYKDIPTEVLLAQAWEIIDLKESDKELYDETFEDTEDWYAFDKSFMDKAIKKMYGDNAIIEINKDVSINLGPGEGFNYDNDTEKYRYSFGGGGYKADNITKYLSAEKDENNMYIYQRYILVETEFEDYDMMKYKENIYKDSTKKEVLKSLSQKEIDLLGDYETVLEDILDSYTGNEQLYKHTFKKNTNGEYYWYSTEPVIANINS